MAQAVLIVAESGAGKSTSIENLNPKETFIINVADKPLPFKGWKNKYKEWTKENQSGNLYSNHNVKQIEQCMLYINEKRPEIKTIIVDDFQYMSAFEFFERAEEKGYDKFTQIGANIVRIVLLPKKMRDDLIVVFLTHVEESTDIYGKRVFRAKTIGKMVNDKLSLEGMFSVVLFGKVKKDGNDNIRYVFETSTDTENTCKSPKGMFSSLEIPNDLHIVIDAIKKYEY